MMGFKPFIYTVLAITLGYLLVSVIPNQLTPLLDDVFQIELPGESVEAGTQQKGPMITEEPELSGDASSAATTADEVETASGLSIGNEVLISIGSLMMSLAVASGVYWVARRQFI